MTAANAEGGVLTFLRGTVFLDNSSDSATPFRRITGTEWTDELHAIRDRLDGLIAKGASENHPTIRGLADRYEAWLEYGIQHDHITPEGVARA